MTNKGFSMSAFIAFGNGCINNVNGNTPDIQSAFKTDLKKAIAHAGYPSKDETGTADEINDFSNLMIICDFIHRTFQQIVHIIRSEKFFQFIFC